MNLVSVSSVLIDRGLSREFCPQQVLSEAPRLNKLKSRAHADMLRNAKLDEFQALLIYKRQPVIQRKIVTYSNIDTTPNVYNVFNLCLAV